MFFRNAVQKSAIRAFVYYLVFTTIYTLALCGTLLWWLSNQYTPTLEVAKHSLPPFEIRIAEGHLSTTLPEPVVFSDARFGFVIDTSGKPLDADAYDEAILISKTKATLKKSRFETREYSWAAVPDFQVTNEDVLDWLIAHKSPILWTLFSVIALGIIPLAWLFLIPVLLFIAVLLVILAKIAGAPLTYGQTVSVSFYAVTLPTLVQTALWFFAPGWASGGTFWLLYLAWATLGVILCRGLPPPPPKTPESQIVPPPPAVT